MTTRKHTRTHTFAWPALCIALAASAASAATFTYDGGTTGTGADLSTAANWVGDVRPGINDEALLNNSVLSPLPTTLLMLGGASTTSYGDVIFNTNNSLSVQITDNGTLNRTLTLNGGSGSAAAIASGGATGDLVLLGTQAVSNTITLGGNTGSGTGGVYLKFTASGNINVANAGATLVLDVTSYDTTNIAATSLNKTGQGTVVLGSRSSPDKLGDSNLGGGIIITAGTLRLGAANRIATKPIVLNGGTFDTGGFNETIGTLQLLNNSTIDLASGSSTLLFSASNSVAWTTGKILSILNWTGLIAGGGTDQLKVGLNSSGLTIDQLLQIRFVNPAGFDPGVYHATQLSTGELVPTGMPIPEPASLSLLTLTSVALLKRRQSSM